MVVVIWIDWYSYHLARFRALAGHPALANSVAGIELVGKGGVHQGLAFRDEERGDLEVETLAPHHGWHESGQLRLAVALWRKLDQLKPEVVLVPGYATLPGIAAALWAKSKGARSILMTESGERDHQRSAWKEKLKGLLIHFLFQYATAGGKEHRRYLVKLGFPLERIGNYYDTVDNEFFAREAASHRRNSLPRDHELPSRYFLYVGRLAEEKNVWRLVQAFAVYRQRGGQWSLVLAGEGPLRRELEALAAELGLSDSICFTGMRRTSELPACYAFASCFILPSTREPWGLVVNEAMASGLPVLVSSQCGCAADLVDPGKNGYVFDPADQNALAARMLEIAALPEALREGMGQESRDRIARYSPENWAAEVASAACVSAPKMEVAA